MARGFLPTTDQLAQVDAMVAPIWGKRIPTHDRVTSKVVVSDLSVYERFFAEFEKSVEDGTAKECFATKFNDIVGKYDFVISCSTNSLTSGSCSTEIHCRNSS